MFSAVGVVVVSMVELVDVLSNEGEAEPRNADGGAAGDGVGADAGAGDGAKTAEADTCCTREMAFCVL